MLLTLHGTGAGTPNADRMASALTATFNDGSVVLFDAGEGCARAMLRDGVDLNRITTVAISHLHPDHWCGLPGLVIAWAIGRRADRVRIFVPAGTEEFFHRVLISSYIFPEWLGAWPEILPLASFPLPDAWDASTFTTTHLARVTASAGEYGLPGHAYGYILRQGERRIILSQDIGSAGDLAGIIDNAELLVCESAHVEPVDVLALACDSRVRRVLFTHVPPAPPQFPERFNGVEWRVACDGDRVSIA